MALRRFLQARSFSTILRGAMLAVALVVQAAPSLAETITLVCQNEGPTPGGGSFTLRVDYDQNVVALLRPDGTAKHSAAATITAGEVRWNAALAGDGRIV